MRPSSTHAEHKKCAIAYLVRAVKAGRNEADFVIVKGLVPFIFFSAPKIVQKLLDLTQHLFRREWNYPSICL